MPAVAFTLPSFEITLCLSKKKNKNTNRIVEMRMRKIKDFSLCEGIQVWKKFLLLNDDIKGTWWNNIAASNWEIFINPALNRFLFFNEDSIVVRWSLISLWLKLWFKIITLCLRCVGRPWCFVWWFWIKR